MKTLLSFAAALVFFFANRPLGAQTAEPKPSWDPSKTLVFVVGTLNWQDSKEYSSFPTKNRRDVDLVNYFRKAGVAENKVVYLQDKVATLAAIRTALGQLLKLSAPGDTLIVYYCGHGYSSADDDEAIVFASYDANINGVEGWSVKEMVSKIEEGFKGTRVILMADCCHSGGMISEVKKKGTRLSYAVYAASESDQSSTGNWTFTESILSAWRGEGPVDADGNGWVTLEEMKKYVRGEMEFAEEQKSKASFTGEWKPEDIVAKARKRVTPREGEHVEVFAENDWWSARIVEEKDGKFKVFYYGYEAEESEWVGPKRIRKPAE